MTISSINPKVDTFFYLHLRTLNTGVRGVWSHQVSDLYPEYDDRLDRGKETRIVERRRLMLPKPSHNAQ